MPAKKKKSAAKPQPAKKVSDAEAANVKGGLTISGGGSTLGGGGVTRVSDSCKETTDTGMMGCPG